MADGSEIEAVGLSPQAVTIKKIAIVGSAPSSAPLAPYDDPAWDIWGCSGGTVTFMKRVSMWFELHEWKGDPAVYGWPPAYADFLRNLKVPCVMFREYPDIPMSVAYPEAAARREFGDYFWTSSIAWMAALAILQSPEEIAFFGIDMAAQTEYFEQRSGLHYFTQVARSRGIKVWAPPQSDLLRPRPQYGMREDSTSVVKLMVRRKELQARQADAQRRQDEAFREQLFLQGALDNLDYTLAIMADQDPKSIAGG